MSKKYLMWLVLAALTCMTVLASTLLNTFQDTIEIALVSSFSSNNPTDQVIAQNNIDAINLYLKSVNQTGGIDGKKVVLSVYDDRGNPDAALRVGEEIVRSNAIAVIGHVGSSLTLAASQAYEKYNMPVISGSATADQLGDFEWFFRTVFSNKEQSVLMANYVKKIMNFSKISCVYSNDAYAVNLAGTVLSTFQSLGGKIVSQSIIGEDSVEDTRRTIQSLKSSMRTEEAPEALIVILSFEKVTEFIRQAKEANLNLPIFGGDTLSDLAIVRHFENDPKEQQEKGFFTNGIRAITPVSFDVLDDSGQQFKAKFEQQYGRDPGWVSACFHDAAVGVVEALKQANISESISNKNTAELRSLVIEGLKRFNSPETAFEGAGRPIFFDSRGNALTPASVGLYDRQELISAYTQLQLVKDPSQVPNLAQKIQSGDILKIGNRYLEKTSIVYVGMDINEVSNIDEETSTYLVDFYLWFRYQGDITADEIEFTNYSIERLDSGEKISLKEPIDAGQDNGINYKIYRMKADFYEIFDFRLYPFDQQVLKIRFRHSNQTRNQLIYVVDLVGMRGAKSHQILEQWQRTGVYDGITSWTVEQVRFFQNTLINSSTFGNRQLIDTNSDIRYSQFNANIHIKRNVLSFSIKNLLPLLFFIIIAYFLMFLPFDQISIEAVSGLLLAVVFYHLSLTDRLPNIVGYTVLLDYAFYVLYILLGLQLLIVVLSHSKQLKFYGIEASHLLGFGRIAFPSIIAISSIVLFWVILQRTVG